MSTPPPAAPARRRPGRSELLAAFAVGALATSAYVLAWWATVERSTCETVGFGDCLGAPLAMVGLGLPVLYVVVALGLRATGAWLPWLAPLMIGLVLVGVGAPLGSLDPPIWLLPVAAGLLTSAWRALR